MEEQAELPHGAPLGRGGWPVLPGYTQGAAGQPSLVAVLSRILRLPYQILRASRPEMSLESLFQHIIFSEHQAEESRRVMREGGACPRGAFGVWSWVFAPQTGGEGKA